MVTLLLSVCLGVSPVPPLDTRYDPPATVPVLAIVPSVPTVSPKRPVQSCPCSSQCTCGCTIGADCTCGNAATGVAPPYAGVLPFTFSPARPGTTCSPGG